MQNGQFHYNLEAYYVIDAFMCTVPHFDTGGDTFIYLIYCWVA